MENDKEKIVSIIIPCFNAEKTIVRSLESINKSSYANSYIEVLLVDGMSDDNTIETVREYQKSNNLTIKIITNERKYQNFGFNLGVDMSKGEIVMRLDAHSTLNPEFLTKSIQFLNMNTDAMAIGCLIETKPQKKNTLIGKGISIVMSSIFGVGGSKFRTLSETDKDNFITVDTAPFCCYRREVFSIIGKYNENLLNSEDLEFHKRMDINNLKTFLNTGITNTYFSRSNYWEFINHCFRNGKWSILPISISDHFIFSIRHLIPLFFTSGILLFPILSLFFPWVIYIFYLQLFL
jgi:glycosyltransferase involved in cell wall biosynthesis